MITDRSLQTFQGSSLSSLSLPFHRHGLAKLLEILSISSKIARSSNQIDDAIYLLPAPPPKIRYTECKAHQRPDRSIVLNLFVRYHMITQSHLGRKSSETFWDRSNPMEVVCGMSLIFKVFIGSDSGSRSFRDLLSVREVGPPYQSLPPEHDTRSNELHEGPIPL